VRRRLIEDFLSIWEPCLTAIRDPMNTLPPPEEVMDGVKVVVERQKDIESRGG